MDPQFDAEFDPFSEDSTQYETQNVHMVSSHVEVSAPKKTRKATQRSNNRGGNFSIDEDKNLVSAWLNTSLDSIKGTDQKSKTFWTRIGELYNEGRGSNHGIRTERSLTSRWSSIQLAVNKFSGYLTQIEDSRPSGTNEIDKIQLAKEMYHEIIGTHFQFDHCWNFLRHQPKWNMYVGQSSSKRKQNGTYDMHDADTINLDDDEFSGSVSVDRPIGRDAAKEARKKGKGDHRALVEIVGQLTIDKKKEHEERMALAEVERIRVDKEWKDHLALETNKLEVKLKVEQVRAEVEKVRAEAERQLASAKYEKIEQKKREREYQIMMTDLNSLGVVQREYIEGLQADILARRCH